MAEYDPDQLKQAADLFRQFYVDAERADQVRVADAQPVLAQLRTTREHLQRLVEQCNAIIDTFDYDRDLTLTQFMRALGGVMGLDPATCDEIMSQHLAEVIEDLDL